MSVNDATLIHSGVDTVCNKLVSPELECTQCENGIELLLLLPKFLTAEPTTLGRYVQRVQMTRTSCKSKQFSLMFFRIFLTNVNSSFSQGFLSFKCIQ